VCGIGEHWGSVSSIVPHKHIATATEGRLQKIMAQRQRQWWCMEKKIGM